MRADTLALERETEGLLSEIVEGYSIMVGEHNIVLDAQKSVTLKLSEPVVDSDNPWADDLLARRQIAVRLTNLIAAQEPPLTISIHGQWGTGKTFMLTRWQKDLENQDFSAVYFNAWEDDFCDDPLLAILGQMSEYFKEGELKTLAHRVIQTAIPLIQKNLLSVLSKSTGLTLEFEQGEQNERDLLKEYLDQRATKDELKEHLTEMSAAVFDATERPLVFIIDELDRCRPTFAIELLEKVKHIFDVPHMVFVLGLNRDELAKSFSSVYGDINTDVYLRRFFDFEFNLPEAESQGFAEHLMDKFELGQVFQRLSAAAHNSGHVYDYDNYRALFPRLWSALDLSLRDIDYGIRLLALLARNVRLGTFTHPFLLAVLIAMKFKKPEFYRSLVTGNFRTSEIMDYIDEESRRGLIDANLSRNLDRSEGFLYCADNANRASQERGETALAELRQVLDGSREVAFLVISRRAQNADQRQLNRIVQAIYDGSNLYIDGKVLGDLAALIDTYQTELRR